MKKNRGDKNRVPTLDLHGFRVDEAIEAIHQFLSDTIIAGDSKAHIIHGHGTGKIQEATHRAVKSSGVVNRSMTHPSNSGVLVVFL